MNIYKKYDGQSAKDKLRELIDLHGHELTIARALLSHVDDEVCEDLLKELQEN
jgi:hypothetical protein